MKQNIRRIAAAALSALLAFGFSGESVAPTHFYFQGTTAQPFQDLPWALSVSYKLNGVAMKAEDLAGKTGVVEIDVDAIPNKSAGDYVRHNYTLEAMAIFNQDDILSLEAPGAQVQLLGNLREVLFIAFPGEEGHFSIRVGAEDFSFGGMTFLMVPATLSQLDEIAKLAEKKEDLENNYDKLSGSLDTLLDSLANVSGSLYSAANGLDALNSASGTVSAGKGAVYDAADAALTDLDSLVEAMEPLSGELTVASKAVTEANEVVRELSKQTVSLRDELDQLKKDLNAIGDSRDDLLAVIHNLDLMRSSLNTLATRLNNASYAPTITTTNLDATVGGFSQAKQLYAPYTNYAAAIKAASSISDETAKTTAMQTALATTITGILKSQGMTDEEVSALLTAKAGSLTSETITTMASSFSGFCSTLAALAGDDTDTGKQLAKLADLYSDDGDAMKFLMDSSDDLAAATSEIETNITNGIATANSTITNLTGPTAAVVRELSALCDTIGELDDLIYSADATVTLAASDTAKIKSILNQIEALQTLLDAYEPETLRALDELNTASNELTATARDTNAFLRSAEDLLQNAGTQLDAATRQSLASLAAALRSTGAALGESNGVLGAKDTITDLIEDTWSDYTGDVNDLLEMDANATIVSLTDPRNPSPQSVQVLLRTQEIKTAADAPVAVSATTVSASSSDAAASTFWGRVAAMFTSMWCAVIGLFHR